MSNETVTITKPAPLLEGSLTAFLKSIDKLGAGAVPAGFKGIDTTKYDPLSRIDQDVFLDFPKKVDMGGQGWFMKTELLKLFLLYPFFKEESGEDIHFSFCLFQAMVDIFVLDKDRNKVDTWQDTTLGERGLDDKAQWKQKQHSKVRDELIKHYVELGWKFQAKSKI